MKRKHLNYRKRLSKGYKFKGGEKMEFNYVKPEDIPKANRGGKGKDWNAIFNAIPVGSVLVMNKAQFGSSENVKAQVRKYIEENGEVLKATQRTNKETEETIVYVQRLE